ncbi:MAG: PTS N-acetylgalactosamine transporter subunit IIB [Negativicutes bacterium]|nr:PTS N-acetylgalactosamine transporter subunit IIB [Negativicutes bacterium]
MPNILLTRIDNRLIHGQVGMTWTNSIGANLVLVANDQVAEDTVQQNLMDMAVPPTVDTRYFTLQKTIDIIGRAAEDQLIFIVVKTPQDALTLVEGGVPIKKINIGNLHYSEGKTQITNTVSIDDEDRKSFKKLMEHGVQLEIRGVPTESATDINKYL